MGREMIYLDSSSLLKLLWYEPESSATIDAIADENKVVVSLLAEMEILVQLKTAYLGGDYKLPQLRRLETQLSLLRNQPPYEFRTLPGTIFQTARRQHRNSGASDCRGHGPESHAAVGGLHVEAALGIQRGQKIRGGVVGQTEDTGSTANDDSHSGPESPR